MRKMEDEYILTCKRFPIEPGDFIRSQEEQYGDAHYIAGVKLHQKLVQHYESILKIARKKPVDEAPLDTLRQFCEFNAASISPIECARRISRSHHGRVLRSVYRLLIARQSNKKFVIWIYGIASSGKSRLIRRLRQLFSGDEVDWRGQYLPVRK